MFEKELKVMIEACRKAKPVIMEIYNQDFEVEIKEDNSPVTLADKKADAIISKHLMENFPSYGLLTEESEDNGERLKKDYVFIVDPVDGTKDFVAKDGMFTINIGLSYKHEAVAGVVYIPARDELYFASRGNKAYYQKEGKEPVEIHVNDKKEDLTIMLSVFHLNDDERRIITEHSDKIKHQAKVGSSIKACYIAEGKAEVSYRFTPNTKEWDTCAAQAIVEEAGGIYCKPDLSPIRYNREDVYNREGFIIINNKDNYLL